VKLVMKGKLLEETVQKLERGKRVTTYEKEKETKGNLEDS